MWIYFSNKSFSIMNSSIIHWSFRELDTIPDSLIQLKDYVEEIYLKENCLKTIPNWMGELKSLNFLNLSCNSIETLPLSFTALVCLEYLNLSFNKISLLPNTFGDLKMLRILDISANNFKFIPKVLGELQNLHLLAIGKNFISNLPVELANCKKLKVLDISASEYLKELPSKIVSMPSLEKIFFQDTKLTYLPPIACFRQLIQQLCSTTNLTNVPVFYDADIFNYSFSSKDIPYEKYDIVIKENLEDNPIFLPVDTRRVYYPNEGKVFSLFDLSLKAVCKSRVKFDPYSLPYTLAWCINRGKLCTCYRAKCSQEIYTEYYLLLFKRKHFLPRVAYFCSAFCAKIWNQLYSKKHENVEWSPLSNYLI